MHYRCNVCNTGMPGQRPGFVPTPDGSQWQHCPQCYGAGVFEPEMLKEPTWYPLQLVVGANATVTNSIQIQNRDLELDQIQGTYTNQGMLLTILDGGRPWMISPNASQNVGTVPVGSVVGTAQNPFELRPRFRIAAKAQLTIIATDTSGAQNTLNFALFGYSLSRKS